MSENNKFIISGSSGWLSRNFIKKLNKHGHSVFGIQNNNMWEDAKQFASESCGKIFLIHNAFELPNREQEIDLESYKNNLVKNFDVVEDFIENVKIESLFYPSTGRVYDQNKHKSELLGIYAEQKLFEEQKLESFASKYNFSMIIGRIFSLIGPNNFFKSHSSFQTLISDSILKEKLTIKSNTNDLHSISIMDNLIVLVLSILLNEEKDYRFKFDVVDRDITLSNFSELIFKILNLDIKNLEYNFDLNQVRGKYIGSQLEYKKLIQQYVKKPQSLESYLLYILKN
tara:strand:- start:87 stop:941 length:855 start_codon:yes stop_codon:yes gene_type:complete